jgi:hypothetical protein
VYIRLGTATIATASTANHTFVIPDGQAMMVEIPENFTHFAAIGSGSGALTWQVVG